jgi:hypothetical protein
MLRVRGGGLGCAKDQNTCADFMQGQAMQFIGGSAGLSATITVVDATAATAADVANTVQSIRTWVGTMEGSLTHSQAVLSQAIALGSRNFNSRLSTTVNNVNIKLDLNIVNSGVLGAGEIATKLQLVASMLTAAAPLMPAGSIRDQALADAGKLTTAAQMLFNYKSAATTYGMRAIYRYQTLSRIQETYVVLKKIADNPNMSPQDVISNVQDAVTLASLVPGVDVAAAPLGIALSLVYPVCGTSDFYNWNAAIGTAAAWASILESNTCTGGTLAGSYDCSNPDLITLCTTFGLSTPTFTPKTSSLNPTVFPTIAPTAPTRVPTRAPTYPPGALVPSLKPTRLPTVAFTSYPTITMPPTVKPTFVGFNGGDSCGDPTNFFGVKYYNFEILFLTTLDDGGDREEYEIDEASSTLELTSYGWLVNGDNKDLVPTCTASSFSLTNYNDDAGPCEPYDNRNDPDGFYACKIWSKAVSDAPKGTPNWYFVVPASILPGVTIDVNVHTYEIDDRYYKDSGSDINWDFTYSMPETVGNLPGNTDVYRYFTRTSDDGRKQRLRYKQRRMCFPRSDFSNIGCTQM